MTLLHFLLLACAVVFQSVLGQLRGNDGLFLERAQADPNSAFREWSSSFQKEFSSVEEFEERLEVWKDNLEYVVQYNAKHTTHWLGMNVFADLTVEEFRAYAFGYDSNLRAPRVRAANNFRYRNTSVPASVDWRTKGAVVAVKNQAQCGSCWAFSATGAIEGINAIVSGQLLSISEQELVDCDRVHDHGCRGGLMDYAFEFIINNGGIDTEDDYPYKGQDGVCLRSRLNRKVVTIDDYEDVPDNDEQALKQAVANQPVSVAIEADARSFQLYQGGVYDDEECGTNLNHGVLAVGYDTTGPEPYWIVKNSWGPFWGDGGYIRMAIGIGVQGICGIGMVPSYPVKSTPNPPLPPPPGPEPPAPPAPEPVQCDDSSECPPGNTCCCVKDYYGYCFIWACCPLPEATCCDDKQHCCPHALPICDMTAGRCIAGAGDANNASVEWVEKQPAIEKSAWVPWVKNLKEALLGA